MPTTRSSRRLPHAKPTTEAGTKRGSDNNAKTRPAKREKLSKKHQKDKTNTPDKSEVEDGGMEESELSRNIAEGKEFGTKSEQGEECPLTTLEQGVIYFFYRGRVDVEEPHGVQDVARSYIVLRPLEMEVTGGEDALDDAGNARLLALPKKMLPKKHGDGFLAFVEKAKCSMKDLREQFSGSEYTTKTSGTRHIPAAAPFAEGVYSITSTDGRSYLTYQIMFPEIGEVQTELGVHEKGRYIVSVKNPEYAGPGSAPSLGTPPTYSESAQEKFEGRRWIPLTPELLDYDKTQLLVIGEAIHPKDKPVEGVSEDQKDDWTKQTADEVDKQETDEIRRCVPHLTQSDPVFADLERISKQYHKMKTTW